MSLKIAADNFPTLLVGETENFAVVREYDEGRDKVAVEEMEKRCEIGQRGKPSLVTDLMGDPICRIRHFPSHVMLVAECGEGGEMAGVIRACIKTVTRGSSGYVKLAYILGLRVSPSHRSLSFFLSKTVCTSFPRRLGIGLKLVQEIEKRCKQPRTLAMLVQPVHAHYKPLGSGIATFRLTPKLAETIYSRLFVDAEFFAKDIGTILSCKLNLGTFMAVPKNCLPQWDPKTGILPSNFAILSVWNTKEVFKLQVKGVSKLMHACCKGSRLLDAWMPWLRLPSFPDVFRQFGVYFLYGLHMEGKNAPRLMKALCAFAHNMARDDDGCGAVVAEVGQRDPVREVIPHWRKFSWAEDLWCIKKLADEKPDVDREFEPPDWMKRESSSPVIFVDPRDS
ncbi:hypothetical protein POTOM_012654 [Populus tomentosa]|uniref:N-acetyltransferase HLS1 n=1 Tax=Populus tomentosa TaxID=118781 RepID=A0A8X8AA10_POPTO|nr:hypothetical protein POTOM_012654 [Populus tomentosa]